MYPLIRCLGGCGYQLAMFSTIIFHRRRPQPRKSKKQVIIFSVARCSQFLSNGRYNRLAVCVIIQRFHFTTSEVVESVHRLVKTSQKRVIYLVGDLDGGGQRIVFSHVHRIGYRVESRHIAFAVSIDGVLESRDGALLGLDREPQEAVRRFDIPGCEPMKRRHRV